MDYKITVYVKLIVKLNNAKIYMFPQDTKHQNGAFFILAQKSEINIGEAKIKTMDVKIDRSKIQAWNSSISNLSGTLQNYSELQATAMAKISVAVDSTSIFNIHK